MSGKNKEKKPSERRRSARSPDIARRMLESIKTQKEKNGVTPKRDEAK